MRLPRPVAWLILGSAVFTAGLLRHFHDEVPSSPYVSPIVGSLLFAAIFLLLLVAARERRLGAVRDRGVRVGSLTPILLMLLLEKWISITFYNPVFAQLPVRGLAEAEIDARYRAFAGAALLVICLLLGALAPGAAQRTWRRARPIRWLPAGAGVAAVLTGTYALLAGGTALLGGGLRLEWPRPDRLWLWIVMGQGMRAMAEETYYRGLLLSELERLAPRLGVHRPAARRWTALVPTAALFSLEHMAVVPPWGAIEREAAFTFSLGLLLGILVMVTNNLHFAAGIHAYVNCLVLGAAPRFVDGTGQAALPPGTYIGIALILAFVLSFFTQKAEPEEPGS